MVAGALKSSADNSGIREKYTAGMSGQRSFSM